MDPDQTGLGSYCLLQVAQWTTITHLGASKVLNTVAGGLLWLKIKLNCPPFLQE